MEASISGDFGRLMGWADAVRKLKVRTNADTPRDAKQAVKFGAEGIGLCRTEHMFFEATRIAAMREMIAGRHRGSSAKRLWRRSCPCSRATSKRMYEAMEGRPDDHPLSWIRRCMSSCPTGLEDEIAELAKEHGHVPSKK